MAIKTVDNLYFDDDGSGSLPVVFVHSLAGSSGQWTAQLDHIRKTGRAIAVDLRGHGRSAVPADGNYEIEAMAKDVEAVVDALGIKRLVLVGHSMGGVVAIAFAGAHPQRVAGLLLVDPSGDSTQMPESEVQQYIGALESDAYTAVIEGYWQQILSGSTAETEQRVMSDLRNTSQEVVVGVSKALFKLNPLPALDRYDGPQQVIYTPLNENPMGLPSLRPGVPHDLILDTGHWLQMDKPDEFNQYFDSFFTAVMQRELTQKEVVN